MSVDYKTGSYENARKKFNPPDPHKNDPHGGDYWRQAVFYKILIENSYQYRNQEVSSVEFDFVEPTESDPVYPKRKVRFPPEDERIVSEQIRSTWEKIHNRDFYTGCGDPDCSYCNFVKQNKLFTKLHAPEPEEEELENYLNEAE